MKPKPPSATSKDSALDAGRSKDSEETKTMARMKFICDAERCIECNSCVTACKNEHEVPWGVNRRRVVTINDGVVGQETDGSKSEFEKYGRNRLAEGKLPACAEMCSTKALLGGDGDVIADIFRNRVMRRGKGSEVWG